jgi:uncharacterized membrane protein
MLETQGRGGFSSLTSIAISALSIVGVGISSYLSYTHWVAIAPYCAGATDCEVVLTSRYAYIGPIPVAILGLAMYLALMILSGGWLLKQIRWLPLTIVTIAIMGTLYSAYLTYVSAIILRALCPWCLASAITIAAILSISLYAFVTSPKPA